MRFSLAQLTRRTRNPRRSQIPLREIVPPSVLATNLYRAAYLPTVQAWERAANRIIAEYERALSRLTTDSPAGVETELSFIEGELQRLFLELTPRLRDWIFRVERWHRGKWRGAVLSATGVDLQTLIGPEDVQETLDTLISRNVALVKDVSAQARGRISDSVFRGLTERRPAREVATEVREAVAMSRRRSINIASDQLTKVSSALDGERMRQAGIEKWKWMHSGKAHPRAEHQARNGKIYTFADPPAEMPGQAPYCGCRKLGVVDLDEDISGPPEAPGVTTGGAPAELIAQEPGSSSSLAAWRRIQAARSGGTAATKTRLGTTTPRAPATAATRKAPGPPTASPKPRPSSSKQGRSTPAPVPAPGKIKGAPSSGTPQAKWFDESRDHVLINGRRDDIEHMSGYDLDTGIQFTRTKGVRNQVALSKDLGAAAFDPDWRLSIHHNHPNSASLSGADMKLVNLPGVHEVWAHGHDDSTYLARAGKKKFEQEALDKANAEMRTLLQAQVSSGAMPSRDASLVQHHMNNLLLHERGFIDYQATLRGDRLAAVERHRAALDRMLGKLK